MFGPSLKTIPDTAHITTPDALLALGKRDFEAIRVRRPDQYSGGWAADPSSKA